MNVNENINVNNSLFYLFRLLVKRAMVTEEDVTKTGGISIKNLWEIDYSFQGETYTCPFFQHSKVKTQQGILVSKPSALSGWKFLVNLQVNVLSRLELAELGFRISWEDCLHQMFCFWRNNLSIQLISLSWLYFEKV